MFYEGPTLKYTHYEHSKTWGSREANRLMKNL